jgi:hypothetical protein
MLEDFAIEIILFHNKEEYTSIGIEMDSLKLDTFNVVLKIVLQIKFYQT